MRAIETCRTAALGGHVYECEQCGAQRICYNSCRNRHCPKYQSLEKERWLEERCEELLPVPYFHVVFTVPEELNPLALGNPEWFYNLLFASASQTLVQIAADPKHLGARIEVLAVLHTWSQTLLLHPHVHCIVPGGGLSPDGQRWVASRADYFLPVQVLSALFRGKFLAGVKAAYAAGQLSLPESLQDPSSFQALLDRLYGKTWVVYSKPPFGSPRQVLAYLARYTHRIALSNSRLLRLEGDRVVFTYKDYAQGGRVREMTLPAQEFIRRFLLHVLPEGFVRIRYYGLLANRHRERDLARCRDLLGEPAAEAPAGQAPGGRGLAGAVAPAHRPGSDRLPRMRAGPPAAEGGTRSGAFFWLAREVPAVSSPVRPSSPTPPSAPARAWGKCTSSAICGRMVETKSLSEEPDAGRQLSHQAFVACPPPRFEASVPEAEAVS